MSFFRIRQLAPALRRAFTSAAQSAEVTSNTSTQHIGVSGRVYHFEELLQERDEVGGVWIAKADEKRYVLKDFHQIWWERFLDTIWPSLEKHPNIRLPCDTIRGQRTVVYEHLSDDFLDLAPKLNPEVRKQVLKSVLHGLAALHRGHVVHLDVKPNNIIVDCSYKDGNPIVEKVQVIEFEDGHWLAPGTALSGRLPGNEHWRSPEGSFRGYLQKPTDMFSFGIVCIYAMLGRVIFFKDSDFKRQMSRGAPESMVRSQRYLSYFGDEEGLDALQKFIPKGDTNVINEVLDVLWEQRDDPEIGYKHFSMWPEVEDEEFKDVVLKMTNFNPMKRITVRQALKHPWFADVEPF